jgi:predicted nucleotidyltransferase
MGLHIKIDRPKIEEFCHKWKITEFSFFGSAVRGDFRPDSDVDVLVSFASDENWDLFDHMTMEEELAGIIGRKVDLLTRRSVERSENWIRRKSILSGSEPYYVAG